jgi:hypothetical protein
MKFQLSRSMDEGLQGRGGGQALPVEPRGAATEMRGGLLKANNSLVSPLDRTTAQGGSSGVFQGQPESNRRR